MNQPSQPSLQRGYQGSIQPKSFPALPTGWVSEWETFPSADGTLQIYGVTHHSEPWKSPRALVVFHGLGEHGGRYLHFPHYLQDVVDAVHCVDHRGHGRSEGSCGYVDTFERYSDDAALAIYRLDEQLKKRFGRSEIHVFGHSLGGLILLRTLFKNTNLPVHSATISAPLLGIRMKLPPVKKMVGIALSKIWGSLHMSNELDVTLLSHDAEIGKVYLADRLCHNKVTPRFFTEMQDAIADTVRRDSGMAYPIHLMIPLGDRIVNPDSSLQFFRNLKAPKVAGSTSTPNGESTKLLTTYPEFFHESFNELAKEKAFKDLALWIKNHSQPLST